MRIYVGNFSYDLTEEELQKAFEPHGKVDTVTIIKDRDTGRSKGFAFVEMASNEEAQAAIAALNGKELKQRAIVVNEARPRQERTFGGGGGSSQGSDRRGGYGGRGGGRGDRR